jgi:neutral ceramidase
VEVGFGRVCITPEIGTRLIGQPEQLQSDGKYTDLYARSLYLKFRDKETIVVSCDLLFLTKENTDGLRKAVSGNTKVPFEHIIVHATHTHAGPALTGLFGEEHQDAKMSEKIYKGIIDSALEAFRRKRSGRLYVGRDERRDLAYNRRYRMKDGTVETHPHKDDPNILEPEGPVDPEVNVLFATDEGGLPLGALANFACHLTSLERNNRKFSADFPAFAEIHIAERLGNKDFVLLYLNGPCGNICQVNVASRNTAEVGIEHTKKMGNKFCESVLAALENRTGVQEDAPLEAVYREIKIPIRTITGKMLRNAFAVVSAFEGKIPIAPDVSNYGHETYMDEEVASTNELLETEFWKYVSAKELVDLHERYKKNKNETIPLTVMSIGALLFITAPVELFAEYSIELKERFKDRYTHVFIFELVNGWSGYVPTRKAFSPKVGGYEVQFLNSSKLDQIAGDRIIQAIIGMEKTITRKGRPE